MKTKTLLKEGLISLVPCAITLNIDKLVRNMYKRAYAKTERDPIYETCLRSFFGLNSLAVEYFTFALTANAVINYIYDGDLPKAIYNASMVLGARAGIYGLSKIARVTTEIRNEEIWVNEDSSDNHSEPEAPNIEERAKPYYKECLKRNKNNILK